ncbi:chaoptin-like [Contarinia nasturtii]|uniref:chaoptin-like n=1 Tax=Contarinia nasturtii TaxID=265458 RepID=UPI0012D380AF|nr:chaoptin-like [Contarinia nasturtii]
MDKVWIKSFFASKNRFVTIPNKIFMYMPNISEIDFSFNRLVSLDSSCFEAPEFNDTQRLALIPELFSINCSHNKISQLDQGAFSNLLLLENLDLGDNEIEYIDYEVFKNNKAIRELSLKNNPLKKLDFNVFSPDVNVVQVHLPSDIEELDASCVEKVCHFADFDDEANFEKLQNFNISGNRRKDIFKLMKKLGSNVKTLDLSQNFVEELTFGMLENFTQLHHLRLSYTNLSNLIDDTFHYQTKLITLDLSHNDLKHLNSGALSKKFRHLEWLNLEGNQLTTIDDLLATYLCSFRFYRTRSPKKVTLFTANDPTHCQIAEVLIDKIDNEFGNDSDYEDIEIDASNIFHPVPINYPNTVLDENRFTSPPSQNIPLYAYRS